MSAMRRAAPAVLSMALLLLGGCAKYTVYLHYPQESGNIFTEQPSTSIFVAEPVDLRSQKEREGKGAFISLRFPADDRLDVPMADVARRAIMQDILATRVARLVQNPENADYLLNTQVLSMTTHVHRSGKQFIVPLLTGVGIGVAAGAGTSLSHGLKWGAVGVLLGTFIPLPTPTEGVVELRMELRDRLTEEVVWSTVCKGVEKDKVSMSISARKDKKLAERFLPKALKRANACAVGQLYQYLSRHSGQEGAPPQEAPMQPSGADSL